MKSKPSLVPLYVALTLGSVLFLLAAGVCSAQVTSLPDDGKAAAVCISPEDGRWMILQEGFVPVEFTQYDLADGGSIVTWQGSPGDLFGAIFWPHEPKSPGATKRIKLTGTTTPQPPGQPPTQPPTTGTIAAQLKAAAEAATSDPSRAKTAQDLAVLASFLGSQIRAGTLTEYQTIALATDQMWDQVTKHTAWSPVKSLIGKHLVALAQQGASAEAYATYFDEVQAGLLASVPQAMQEARPERVNIELLMMLLKFFLEVILPLIMGGL